MAFENKAAVGKSFGIFLALEDSVTPPIDANFTALAATRDLTFGPRVGNRRYYCSRYWQHFHFIGYVQKQQH